LEKGNVVNTKRPLVQKTNQLNPTIVRENNLYLIL
jgi:hypothetical protein